MQHWPLLAAFHDTLSLIAACIPTDRAGHQIKSERHFIEELPKRDGIKSFRPECVYLNIRM
jgi:hypothetical protein